jgi:hypothetical protein
LESISATVVVTSKDLNTDLPASLRPVSARLGGGSSLASLASAGCDIAAKGAAAGHGGERLQHVTPIATLKLFK